MQFNHLLVRDEEPLLFHAGFKGTFPALHEAVGKLIDPTKLRHIAWSHFESDEIGALNYWQVLAPQAQPVCTLVGKSDKLLTDSAGVVKESLDGA